MANYTVTAASVLAVRTGVPSTDPVSGYGGEAFTQCVPVYDVTDAVYGTVWKKADATTVTKARVTGLSLGAPALAGAPTHVLKEGDINPGFTGTIGDLVVLSATSGRLCPEADLVTGNIITEIGRFTTTTNLKVRINPTGIVK